MAKARKTPEVRTSTGPTGMKFADMVIDPFAPDCPTGKQVADAMDAALQAPAAAEQTTETPQEMHQEPTQALGVPASLQATTTEEIITNHLAGETTLDEAVEQLQQGETLTEDEENRLQVLEHDVEAGLVASARALRTIRQDRLYRAGGRSFDDYVEQRWDHKRAWAHRRIAWLDCIEKMQTVSTWIQLPTESETRELHALDNANDMVKVLEAAQAQAAEQGGRKADIVKELAKRLLAFNKLRDKVPTLTDAEFNALQQLPQNERSQGIFNSAQTLVRKKKVGLPEAIIDEADEAHKFPDNYSLLDVARGPELTALVAKLKTLPSKWETLKTLEQQKAEHEKALKDVQAYKDLQAVKAKIKAAEKAALEAAKKAGEEPEAKIPPLPKSVKDTTPDDDEDEGDDSLSDEEKAAIDIIQVALIELTPIDTLDKAKLFLGKCGFDWQDAKEADDA